MQEESRQKLLSLARAGYPLAGPVDTEMLLDYGIFADPNPPTEREIAAICAAVRNPTNNQFLGNRQRKRPAAEPRPRNLARRLNR
jgi:CRISPR/Cas system-associated exonuclease Cas4 (RecB family)